MSPHTSVIPVARTVPAGPVCVPIEDLLASDFGHIRTTTMALLNNRMVFVDYRYDAGSGNYLPPRMHQAQRLQYPPKSAFRELDLVNAWGVFDFSPTLNRYLAYTSQKDVFLFSPCEVEPIPLDVSAHPGWYFLQDAGYAGCRLWSLTSTLELWYLDLLSMQWAQAGTAVAPNFSYAQSYHTRMFSHMEGSGAIFQPGSVGLALRFTGETTVVAKECFTIGNNFAVSDNSTTIEGNYIYTRSASVTLSDTIEQYAISVDIDGGWVFQNTALVHLPGLIPEMTTHEIAMLRHSPYNGGVYVMLKDREPSGPDNSIFLYLYETLDVADKYLGLKKYAGPFVVEEVDGEVYYGVDGMSIGWAVAAPTSLEKLTL